MSIELKSAKLPKILCLGEREACMLRHTLLATPLFTNMQANKSFIYAYIVLFWPRTEEPCSIVSFSCFWQYFKAFLSITIHLYTYHIIIHLSNYTLITSLLLKSTKKSYILKNVTYFFFLISGLKVWSDPFDRPKKDS